MLQKVQEYLQKLQGALAESEEWKRVPPEEITKPIADIKKSAPGVKIYSRGGRVSKGRD